MPQPSVCASRRSLNQSPPRGTPRASLAARGSFATNAGVERQQSIEAGCLFPSPKARPRKYVPRNRGPGLSQDGDGRSRFISYTPVPPACLWPPGPKVNCSALPKDLYSSAALCISRESCTQPGSVLRPAWPGCTRCRGMSSVLQSLHFTRMYRRFVPLVSGVHMYVQAGHEMSEPRATSARLC